MRPPAVSLSILYGFAIACGTRGAERAAEQPAPEQPAPWPEVPRRCRADLGCPDQRVIPPCPPERAGVPPADLAGNVTAGEIVTVAARLVQECSITYMHCEPAERCCNSAGGEAKLVYERGWISLVEPDDFHAFWCKGDDTLLCSPFSPNEPIDVLATGAVVAFDPPAAGQGAAFGLERPELCRVAAAAE